jgi:hypothetical protein
MMVAHETNGRKERAALVLLLDVPSVVERIDLVYP